MCMTLPQPTCLHLTAVYPVGQGPILGTRLAVDKVGGGLATYAPVHLFVVRVLVRGVLHDRQAPLRGRESGEEDGWCSAARGRRSLGCMGLHLRRVLADRLLSLPRPAVLFRRLLGRSFLSLSYLGICTADYVSELFLTVGVHDSEVSSGVDASCSFATHIYLCRRRKR